MDANGKSDPFVVCELVQAKKQGGKWTGMRTTSKTKTNTIQTTLNPVWNFEVYNL